MMICSSGIVYIIDGQDWSQVGLVDGGILAGSWSPNHEYIAVVTKHGKLIVFNKFEIRYEVEIDDDARTIRDAEISWQGDSTMLVINYRTLVGRKCLTINVKKNRRVVRARTDNQAVMSVSKAPVPTLELPICFMPDGSCVTGFQRRQQMDGEFEPQIIFWKKNGLRNGEFDLPKAVNAE